MFATLAAVAAVSQALTGNEAGTWLASGSALGFGAVFVASIRRGVGGFAAADRVALAVAVAGTVVSVVMARPLLAVLGVVIAELGAVGLTVRKSLDDPGSETRSTWIIDGLAGLLSIVALDHMTTTTLLYPVHHTLANGTVAARSRSDDDDRSRSASEPRTGGRSAVRRTGGVCWKRRCARNCDATMAR